MPFTLPPPLAALVSIARACASAVPAHVRLLVLLMALDLVGAFLACRLARRCVRAGFRAKLGACALCRKAMILLVTAMGLLLDTFIDSAAISGAVTMFYLMGEALSVLESAVALGVPVPARLLEFLGRTADGEPPDGSAPLDGDNPPDGGR